MGKKRPYERNNRLSSVYAGRKMSAKEASNVN